VKILLKKGENNMALNTAIRGLQIRDAFFGDGLKRNAGDGDIAELDLKSSGGLKIDTAQLAVEPADFAGAGLVDDGSDNLAVNVDDATIEIASGNIVAVKDGGITEAKLAMNNSPSAGNVITWNAGAYMEWVDPDVNSVVESDIKFENESANCNGVTTDFILDSTPVANSVQVYLNGLLQESGSGKDYTLSGTTVSFAVAPETANTLLIHYIAAA